MPRLYYPFLALVDLLVTAIAALLFNWWIPVFARLGPVCDRGACRSGVRLPDWLAWFDTFDADLDTGNRDRYGGKGYWGRVLWLYRNNTYGFNYWALGIPFDPKDWTVLEHRMVDGKTIFKARSIHGHFNIYTVWCGIRIKLGWKAWNMYDPESGAWRSAPWGPEWRIPFVFSLSKA